MTALLGLATRLGLARLLLITGARTEEGDLAEFADASFAGGVDIMQLRDPSAGHDELLAALEMMRQAGHHYQGLVSVYESGRLAEEFQADLLHLPERGDTARKARGYLHRWALIGHSCHSRDQVDTALADPDVNYLTVGPAFGGLTAEGGLDLVRYAATVAAPLTTGAVAFVTHPVGPVLDGRVTVVDLRPPLLVPVQAMWQRHTRSPIKSPSFA